MKGAGVEPACSWRPSRQTVYANPLSAVASAGFNVVRAGIEPAQRV